MKRTVILLSSLVLIQAAPASVVIFADTFDRADNGNIDAALTGITDNTGSSLAVDGVYSQPHTTGGETDITGNQLRLAVGAGTSNAYVNHNFVNSNITTTGGMTVSIDVTGYANTERQFGGGFAIGMSAAEAASAADASDVFNPSMTGAFAYDPYGITGGPVAGDPSNIVSDFWIGIRGNNSLAWGSSTGNVLGIGQNGLAARTGTIAVNFFFSDFNAGSNVGYEVFYNSASQGTGSFAWSGTNENYIGIDGRSSVTSFDNFSVATVPEPSALILSGLGLLGLLRRRR